MEYSGRGAYNAEKWGHRLTTVDCASYSIRSLLAPGRTLPRTDDGTRVIPVMSAEGAAAGLAAAWIKHAGGSPPPLPSTIGVRPIAQHFGGVRWLLVCPRCGTAVRKLYGHRRFGDRLLLCRGPRCGNLTYPSRRADDLVRLDGQAQKWKWRLEAPLIFDNARRQADGKPPRLKPKGMHWTTFERIRERWWDYTARTDQLIGERLDTWCDRHPRPTR